MGERCGGYWRVWNLNGGVLRAIGTKKESRSGSELDREDRRGILGHFGRQFAGSTQFVGAHGKLTADGKLVIVAPYIALKGAFRLQLSILFTPDSTRCR